MGGRRLVICTFYSYKGGVGRSMAMANVADLLARRGLKVLMIDFDLEAPGLERFFQINQESVLRQAGLLDLVLAYKRSMSVAGSEAEFKDLERFICPVYEKLPGSGFLHLMPAGRRHGAEQLAQYALSLRTLDWQDFYFNWQGELFFEWVRRSLTQRYDLVLIDSRTGVTEMGGICGYQLPDVLVMMCAANHQNIEGTRNMVRDFRSASVAELRRGRPLEIVVVPARIEQHDPELLAGFFQRFDSEFSASLPARLVESGRSFRDLMVPYEPAFAFEERVVSDPLQYAQRKRISSAFEQLAEAVCWLAEPTSQLGSKAGPPVSAQGESSASTPAARAPAEPLYDVARRFSGYDVFVESSPRDRQLVEELCQRLKQRGLQVFYDRNDVSLGVEWESVVGEALFHSRALITCQGSEPLSEWRVKTLMRARENPAIRLLTLRLPGSEARSYPATESFAHVDLRNGIDDSGLEQLVAALELDRRSAAVEVSALEPFPGPRAFDEEHGNLFFGRALALERLRELVEQQPVAALCGASGSGKTSLVRGGLIPALRAHPGSAWQIHDLRPDADPVKGLEALKVKLEATPASEALNWLLVIDPFEELLSQTAKPARNAFLAALNALRARVGAAKTSSISATGVEAITGPRLHVLLVVRSDFTPELDDLGPLAVPKNARLTLEAMNSEELLSALVGPAECAGLAFEPGLAERILSEMQSEPHALPLLQSLLRKLWERRREGWLTNAAYDGIGGLAGVAARSADELYDSFDAPGQKVMTSLALALVTIDPSGKDYTRSQVRLESLRPAAAEHDPEVARNFDRTIEAMLAAGLLRVTEQDDARQVELGHEALLRGWARLRQWVDAEREGLRVRQALEIAQRAWTRNRKSDEALLRGEILNVAKRFRDEHADALTLEQVNFIDASLAAKQRTRRRNISLLAIAASLMVTVVSLVSGLRTNTEKALAGERAAKESASAAASAALAASQYTAARNTVGQLRSEGDKLLLEGRIDDAIERYVSAATTDPSDASTVFQLGVLRLKKADAAGADRDISKAIELGGDSSEVAQYYLKRGDVRLGLGHDAEALADYEAASLADPDNRATWFALGRAQDKLAAASKTEDRKREASELAIKAYSYAISKDGEFGEAYFNRGAAYERLGDRDAATKDFAKVTTLEKVDSQVKLASQARASKLGAKPAAKQQTQVFFQYVEARDEPAIAQLMGSLKGPAYKIEPAQRVKASSSAQVRFFFPEDQTAAIDLGDKIQRQLAGQGYVLRVATVRLDGSSLKGAKAGRVEVWLPPLSTSVSAAPRALSLSPYAQAAAGE